MTPTFDEDKFASGTSRDAIAWRLNALEEKFDTMNSTVNRIESRLTEYHGFGRGVAAIAGAVGSLLMAAMLGLLKMFSH